MTDIRKNPPFVVRFMLKKMEAKETIFMRLGKLLYVLRDLKHSDDPGVNNPVPVEGDYWIGGFSVIDKGHKTYRRFYDDADGIWTIFKQPEGWELQKREVPPSQQVDEARRKKVEMAEPLDMKAELMLSIIDKEFQKERGIPTKINLFGRGLTGTLTRVQRNNDNSVSLHTQIQDSATQEIWTSIMTVTNKDFKYLRLTRENGKLELVGNASFPMDEALVERDDEEPIFVSMLRRLVDAGKSVYSTAYNHETDQTFTALIKDVHFNKHFGTMDIDVEFEGNNGPEEDQFGYTEDELAELKLKNENDTWFIVDMDGNYR